jgi:hypothetical protein
MLHTYGVHMTYYTREVPESLVKGLCQWALSTESSAAEPHCDKSVRSSVGTWSGSICKHRLDFHFSSECSRGVAKAQANSGQLSSRSGALLSRDIPV